MPFVRLFAVVGIAGALSGCSSTISAWKARPVAAHDLAKDRFFTLTGERRLAFFVGRPQSETDRRVWCAEALPDAAMEIRTNSKAGAGKSPLGALSIDDKFEATLVKTYDRKAVSDIYRQVTFFACSNWASGAYTTEQYVTKADAITLSMLQAAELLAKGDTAKAADTAKPADAAKPAEATKCADPKAGDKTNCPQTATATEIRK